jgi:hypothetical protein
MVRESHPRAKVISMLALALPGSKSEIHGLRKIRATLPKEDGFSAR